MRNFIFAAVGVAILCASCASCTQKSDSRSNPAPAPVGPTKMDAGDKGEREEQFEPTLVQRGSTKLVYGEIERCYGDPNKWAQEVDPKTQNITRVCRITVDDDPDLKNYGTKCNYSSDEHVSQDSDATDYYPDPKKQHKAVDFVLQKGDHVYFNVRPGGPDFRVRRFVRTNRSASNTVCPKNPFMHQFTEQDHFMKEANTKASIYGSGGQLTLGCIYKFEIQLNKDDPTAPDDTLNGGRKFYCIDPHIRFISLGKSAVSPN